MGEREFLPNLAELIDRMSITQIKVILSKEGKEDFQAELAKIRNDIMVICGEKSIELTGEIVHAIVSLAQVNLHIWNNKDLMQATLHDEESYLQLLKIAHQINGYRNKIKNKLIEVEGISDKSQMKSNFETDGLNWDV
jgi:hypothetical protein